MRQRPPTKEGESIRWSATTGRKPFLAPSHKLTLPTNAELFRINGKGGGSTPSVNRNIGTNQATGRMELKGPGRKKSYDLVRFRPVIRVCHHLVWQTWDVDDQC